MNDGILGSINKDLRFLVYEAAAEHLRGKIRRSRGGRPIHS